MNIIDTTRKLIEQWPEEDEEGYVIALRAQYNNPLACVRFFIRFHISGARTQVVSGGLNEATLYTDFSEALEFAQQSIPYWGKGAEDIEILHIQRRRPVKLMREHPITLLDAIAEI